MSGQQGFLSAELARRFGRRIADSLAEEPVTLEPDAHREQVRELLARLGELNFYELLGIGPGGKEDEVYRAYKEVARLAHPSHAPRLRLEGREAALEILFERLTEAYLTLSDPDRSLEYQLAHGEASAIFGMPDEAQRKSEAGKEADRQFKAARAFMLEGKYHDAVLVLEQTVRLSPDNAEYHAVLGECLAHNPHWVHRAVEHYGKALEIDPRNADLHAALGRLYESSGHRSRAREAYQAALSLNPVLGDAQTGLERLTRSDADEAKSSGGLSGLLARLKRLFGAGRR